MRLLIHSIPMFCRSSNKRTQVITNLGIDAKEYEN